MKNFKAFILLFAFITATICVHELFHMLAARNLGVSTEKFQIGMGSSIASIKLNGVIYSLGLIPLGGMVEVKQDEFIKASLPIKIAILAAGPLANFLISFLLLIFISAKIFNNLNAKKSYRPNLWQKSILYMMTSGKMFILTISENFSFFFKKKGVKNLVTPIGMIKDFQELIEVNKKERIIAILKDFSEISIFIGFINLLPVPFFDGGKIVIFSCEALFGPSPVYSILVIVSLLAMIGFTAFLIGRDLFNLIVKRHNP